MPPRPSLQGGHPRPPPRRTRQAENFPRGFRRKTPCRGQAQETQIDARFDPHAATGRQRHHAPESAAVGPLPAEATAKEKMARNYGRWRERPSTRGERQSWNRYLARSRESVAFAGFCCVAWPKSVANGALSRQQFALAGTQLLVTPDRGLTSFPAVPGCERHSEQRRGSVCRFALHPDEFRSLGCPQSARTSRGASFSGCSSTARKTAGSIISASPSRSGGEAICVRSLPITSSAARFLWDQPEAVNWLAFVIDDVPAPIVFVNRAPGQLRRWR